MRYAELVKYAAYRLPIASRLMSPSYGYKVDPGELGAMLGFIDASRPHTGAIIEIGVAQGQTSAFLLEHLRTTGDPRQLHLFDTFDGFTASSIDVEVARGKARDQYDRFRYGDEGLFNRRLRSAGYSAFRTYRGDAAQFDWASLGPIGAVLLDIDLYQPTKAILNGLYPHLCAGGGIVVDDCVSGGPWDGSLQAYEEFIAHAGLPFRRVGSKGAVLSLGSGSIGIDPVGVVPARSLPREPGA